jgi:type I restriction enzyme M protein
MPLSSTLESKDSPQTHPQRQQAQNLGTFVWSIAEILRGDFKQSDYGKVILPFVVMRRLDCILEGSKRTVLEAAKSLPKDVDDATKDMILFGAAGSKLRVYNRSAFTFATLKGQDAGQLQPTCSIT